MTHTVTPSPEEMFNDQEKHAFMYLASVSRPVRDSEQLWHAFDFSQISEVLSSNSQRGSHHSFVATRREREAPHKVLGLCCQVAF